MLVAGTQAMKTAQSAPKHAQDPGERIYMNNCESCHMLGKNMINPEKEIVSSPKLTSKEIFKDFLLQRNGVMPAFPEIANNDRDLKELYAFVKRLKRQRWEYEQKEPSPPAEPERPKQPPVVPPIR